MKRTPIGNTLRDIANESAVNKAEAYSLKLIATKYDALKESHTKLMKRIYAIEDLLVCYRVWRRPPSESLHKRLSATKDAIAEAKKL